MTVKGGGMTVREAGSDGVVDVVRIGVVFCFQVWHRM